MSATAIPVEAWHYKSSGPPAHFYHANGFPIGLYEPLLTRLGSRLNLSALPMRPTWPTPGPPPRQRNWRIYVDDLLRHLETRNDGPVIGMGHSMGAACTVMAAHRRPDLFDSLILIETVMVTRWIYRLMRLMPGAVMLRTQPSKGTLNKRHCWGNRDEFYAAWSQHRTYQQFDVEGLQALREHAVRDTPDGNVELVFDKAWEAHNYTLPPYLIEMLADLTVPVVSIQTRPSIYCAASLWKEWRTRCPDTQFIESPEFGHLLPLESASSTIRLIDQALEMIPSQQ